MPEFKISEHYEHEFNKDPDSVLIEIHSEEQEKSYSCGPAVLTDIIKTHGENVSQLEILNEVRRGLREIRPEDSKESIAKLGTPPEIMTKVLEAHGIEFKIKESVVEINEETDKEAEAYLDATLKEGYAIICPVQTIPNYQKERNIDDDGHYLIVCGQVTSDGKKCYITVDPMFHYYQRLSNEGSVYGMHMGDAATEHTPKTDKELAYESVATRDIQYSDEELKKFGIDPSKYGYRLISAKNFIRNWKDVSGFGKPYNQYGIAVRTNPDFNELPQDVKDLARETINASDALEDPWKSSPDEPYAIRRFNNKRSGDTQRYKDMDRHKTTLKWMAEKRPSNNEDLDYLLRIDETDDKDPRIVWAVADKNGEALGWVQFYKDQGTYEAIRKKVDMPEDALVLEVSYSKLFKDWPKYSRFIKDRTNLIDEEGTGVAVNGLKQSLIRLSQMEQAMSSIEKPARRIFITAATDPEHTASEKVLLKNGFNTVGVIDYEGEENNAWYKEI